MVNTKNKKARYVQIIKKIVSYALTAVILIFWIIYAFFATLAKRELMLSPQGTPISSLILLLPLTPYTLLITLLALIWLFATKRQHRLAKSRYFSLNIFLISLLWSSIGIASNVRNGTIKYTNDYNIIELPGRLMLKLFTYIPGFFPFHNNFFSIVKDFFLNSVSIFLIYTGLMTLYKLVLLFSSAVGKNFLKLKHAKKVPNE